MTTATVTPQTPEALARPSGLTFLSKAVRATGYGRVATGPLATGTCAGQRAHLVLPIERVAAADIRLRTGGTRLVVNVTGDHPTGPLARRAGEAAAAACGLDAAEIALALRLPMRPSDGTDTDEATVVAIIDAVAKASEAALTTTTRADLVRTVLGRPTAGLAAGRPAVIGANGRVLASPDEPARLLLVLAQPADGGASTTKSPGDVGTLTEPAPDLSTPEDLAAWLVACSGGSEHPVAVALRAAVDGASTLGVIGGHTPSAPVAALLRPAALTDAQSLCRRLLGTLPEGWRVSMAKTSVG